MNGIPEIEAPGDAGLNTKPMRPRSYTQPSRGKPAASADTEAEITVSGEDADDEPMPTRRSRRGGAANPFEVPAHLKRRGWDYEWKTMTVMGQPVGASEVIAIQEGGWRPVKADDMKEICPPDHASRYIEREGQRLYTRPMHLTEEARAEDVDIARTVMRDKLAAAMATPDNQPKSMPRKIEGSNTLEVEIGTYKPPT